MPDWCEQQGYDVTGREVIEPPATTSDQGKAMLELDQLIAYSRAHRANELLQYMLLVECIGRLGRQYCGELDHEQFIALESAVKGESESIEVFGVCK